MAFLSSCVSLILLSSFVRERADRWPPDDIASSVHRLDLETGAILGDMLLALLRCHVAQQNDRALDGVPANMVERPHVLVVEPQMRLRHQRLAVATHETEILDAVGQIPAVVALFPFAASAEATHCRGRPTLIFRCWPPRVRASSQLPATGAQ